MVLKKLMKLRKIVPTCEEADIDTLFRKTAEHIALLELQVTSVLIVIGDAKSGIIKP
ncbi:hypothetical protein QJS10_CPB17g00128 [Acorus calamus]|uniref:Uncharacterized protein n=1 Tax=Acorus calamus TaxID=4465 RepID=A0AAV9CV48_ACOCL|nr:hypothetical protein QJS10_CPB17g00128 [Acorus calamus]